MLSRTLVIENEEGLHMRPAGVLSKEMGKYSSDVTIISNGQRVNAKSMINIIEAVINCGQEVTFEIEGDDEAEAMAKLEELQTTRFGE